MLAENAPQYVDIPTVSGDTLRVVYEMTMGEVIIAAAILSVLVYMILNGIMKVLWR